MLWDQFLFRDKGLLMQNLHPASALTYLAVLLMIVLALAHPLLIVGVLAVVVLALGEVDGLGIWKTYLKLSGGLVALIMVVNPMMTRAGETLIWRGPPFPVIGPLTISLEAVVCAAVASVKLIDVVSIFCLYNLMVHPDKIMNVLSRFAFKFALMSSLAARMFPSMIRRLESIREAQASRGVDFRAGTPRERVRKYAILLNVLLLSSLEDSLDIAEAMRARGFGTGKRSSYRRDVLRPRDAFCLGGNLTAVFLAVLGRFKGYIDFDFYPYLGALFPVPATPVFLAAILAALSVPVLLSWGWRRCTCIKLRI